MDGRTDGRKEDLIFKRMASGGMERKSERQARNNIY